MSSALQKTANRRLKRRDARASIREAIRRDKAVQTEESDYSMFGVGLAASSPITLGFGGVGAWILVAAGVLSPELFWVGFLPIAVQTGLAVHRDKIVYAWRQRKGRLTTEVVDLGELQVEPQAEPVSKVMD